MAYNYTTKVDKRALGYEVFITGEVQIISNSAPYIVHLVEVPRQDTPSTIVISGYTEITTGTPGDHEFLVNYLNGEVIFNINQAGQTISIDYWGIGSWNWASDINDLQNKKLDNNGDEIVITEPSSVGLSIKGVSGQTANLFQVKDIFNVVKTKIDANGFFSTHQLVSDPVGLISVDEGKEWYNTTDKQKKMWDGTKIVILG